MAILLLAALAFALFGLCYAAIEFFENC